MYWKKWNFILLRLVQKSLEEGINSSKELIEHLNNYIDEGCTKYFAAKNEY